MFYGLIRYAKEKKDVNINLDIYSQTTDIKNPFARKVEIAIKTLNKENLTNLKINHKQLFLPSLKPISYQNIKNLISSIWQFKKIVNKKMYDIVYANTVRTGIISGIAKYFFSKHTKTIFMSHDYTFPKFLGKLIISKFSQILACSYAVKQSLLKIGIKPWKIEVIQNGVDIEFLKNLKPLTPPLFNVGIIGRISEWKGQMTVLKSAKWLKENAKEFPFKFTFYGTTSNKLEDMKFEQQLHKFVKENNLSDIITFAGFTSLSIALEQSSIIIHAAIQEEPFGRTPIEAAASKRIVCISNIGTPAEIFTDKENAFFFEAGNEENLAHTLAIIVHNTEKALQIAENGQKLVEEKFNISKISKLFWRFFIKN